MDKESPLRSEAQAEPFAQKVAEWAATLDERSEAMLVDLLAKAGGDVYGLDAASTIVRDGADATSSEVSPLELRDFRTAVLGILTTEPPQVA